jgi:hypothetical protein
MKTPNGGQRISGLVNFAATHDIVYEDFVRCSSMHARKTKVKVPIRLANGQRVTSSTVSEISFELARHEFQRTFYVLHDLRAACLLLGLP